MGVIADMIRAGIDPDIIERVAQEIADARAEGARAGSKDEQAERRRAADRERKRNKKLLSAEFHTVPQNSAESAEAEEPEPSSRAEDITTHAHALIPVGELNSSPRLDNPPISPPEKRASRNSFAADAERDAAFARFWEIWPHKTQKPYAEKCFAKVWREADQIIAGVKRYIATKPADRNWMNPSTFLNQRRWEDAPAAAKQATFAALVGGEIIALSGSRHVPKANLVAAIARWKTNPASWPLDAFGEPPDSPFCAIPNAVLLECGVPPKASQHEAA